MKRKIAILLLALPILARFNFSEITEITNNIWTINSGASKEYILNKLDDIGEEVNKEELEQEKEEIKNEKTVMIRVKLNYKNPKITTKNEIYYVNGKAYRGKVYKKGNDVINEVDLEEYLYSVVSSEMPVYFGEEALKSQAVAARTYALTLINLNKNKNFDVYDSILSQVYKGILSEKKEIVKAVNDTKGEIITYNGEPILAVYHSSSGDKTKSSKEVFGRAYPYLTPVKDFASSKTWTYKISKSKLEKKLGTSYAKIVNMNRNTIRKKLGTGVIKSTNFSISSSGNNVVIRGKGFGHGVGLSQWGAKYLGEVNNYSYEQILKHYYQGTDIEKIGDIAYNE